MAKRFKSELKYDGKIDVSIDFRKDVYPGKASSLRLSKAGTDVEFLASLNDGHPDKPKDPDSDSNILANFHKKLWSKKLQNGEKMTLELSENTPYTLTYKYKDGKDFVLSSDTMHPGQLRKKQMKDILAEFIGKSGAQGVIDFYEEWLSKCYTIGGFIIFPKRKNSINQKRGTDTKIRDRFDLTLECIRRHYNGKPNLLQETFEKDSDFFALFGAGQKGFQNYVNFFLLQDLVSENYENVICLDGDGKFISDFLDENGDCKYSEFSPFPKSVDAYIKYIEICKSVISKRNKRIKEWVENNEE